MEGVTPIYFQRGHDTFQTSNQSTFAIFSLIGQSCHMTKSVTQGCPVIGQSGHVTEQRSQAVYQGGRTYFIFSISIFQSKLGK